MKFKAKILDNIKDEEFIEDGRKEGWIDEDNYIYGWYVDGYIVGPIVDVGDDHIELDYWCEVDKSTLSSTTDDSEKVESVLKQKILTYWYSKLNEECSKQINNNYAYDFKIENNKGFLENEDFKITFHIKVKTKEPEPDLNCVLYDPFPQNFYSLKNIKVERKNINSDIDKLLELIEHENKDFINSSSNRSWMNEFIANYGNVERLVPLFLKKNEELIKDIKNKESFFRRINLYNKWYHILFIKEIDFFDILIVNELNGILKISIPLDKEGYETKVYKPKGIENIVLSYTHLLHSMGMFLDCMVKKYDNLKEEVLETKEF